MSEQNKIDEIKEALAAATEIRTSPWNIGRPSPNGCINIGSRGVMVAQCLEPSPAELIAKAPEYITYLLAEIERLKGKLDKFQSLASDNHTLAANFEREIERKDEALKRIEEELTDDTSEKAQRINEIIAREAL